MDSGLAVRITSSSERIDVNQICGSDAVGFSSPRAIASSRSPIFAYGAMPTLMTFICVPMLVIEWPTLPGVPAAPRFDRMRVVTIVWLAT